MSTEPKELNNMALADKAFLKVVEEAGVGILKDKVKSSLSFVEGKIHELPFHQHLVVSVLGCDYLNVLIRLNFNLKDAKILSSYSYGVSVDEINLARTLDFMKELLNLIVGKVKKFLLKESIYLGSSIPISLPGFNDVFFHGSATDLRKDKCFKFDYLEKSIYLSFRYEYLKQEAIDRMAHLDLSSLNEDNEPKVELF